MIPILHLIASDATDRSICWKINEYLLDLPRNFIAAVATATLKIHF
jgi:hypothetical protein